MKLFKLFTGLVMMFSLAGGTLAATKAEQQAEVRKAAQTSLAKFYKADPKLKAAVGKAPGYAVFTSFGISFLVGGAGGKGIVHNNKTKKDTFMAMAQASAGVQIGAAETETLIVFQNEKGMAEFIEKGWTGGGSAAAQAGADGKSAGTKGAGEVTSADAMTYSLTKNGLRAGIAAEGSKFWVDKDLN